MSYSLDSRKQDRAQSLAAVIAIHAALGYALISGMGLEISKSVDAGLNVIDLTPAKPAEAQPDKKPAESEEGAASPENLQAKASQIVLPPPEVKLDIVTPVVAAPVAGIGDDDNAGASDRPGPGAGSGGEGEGSGSGGSGDGNGSGGIVSGPRHLSGAMTRRDIPRSVWKAEARGNVIARFTVGADGRARGCEIKQSSGHSELDATTCRLIETRFRFEPARDARGRPVASPYGWVQEWWRDGRGPQRTN
ncbi:energy transducer TonB [Parasphingorhabdus sp.]|uniref:energy transducer TonB n=1 Tax=Parasphingorhabdus sp. TaxID=2709688 RepID=UPI003A8EB6F9